MLIKRKILVYDIKCDKCSEVLTVGHKSGIRVTAIATFQHDWDASSYVWKGKPLLSRICCKM